MAPRTNRTTRIPSGVASPVATNHAADGSVFVNLRDTGNLAGLKRHLIEGEDASEPEAARRHFRLERQPVCRHEPNRPVLAPHLMRAAF